MRFEPEHLAVARTPADLRQRRPGRGALVCGRGPGRRIGLRRRAWRLLGWLFDDPDRGRPPVDGPRGRMGPRGEPRPAFDQQPIEVAALADAARPGLPAHR